MKKLSLYNLNKQLKIVSLNHSWNLYLYLMKYDIIVYFDYDGMETLMIYNLKNKLLKSNHKLLIVNKQQITHLFKKSNSNEFNFFKNGQHLLFMFNKWTELVNFLNDQTSQILVNRYNLTTVSYKGLFLNLHWNIELTPADLLIKMYQDYTNNFVSIYLIIIYVLHILIAIYTFINILLQKLHCLQNLK